MKQYPFSVLSLFFLATSLTNTTVHMPNFKSFKYKQIVLLSDWDTVIANEKGAFSKLFVGLGAIPASTSLRILFKRGGTIVSIMKKVGYDGKQLKGLAANIDYLAELEPSLKPYRNKLMVKLNGATPHTEIITYYQELQEQGLPLIIATNNDYESLTIKTTKLNAKLLKKKRKSFTFNGCYCGGSFPTLKNNKAPNGMPAGSVWLGKDCDEYFEKLFTFVESEFGYNRTDTLFIFIDDLDKNIHRARRVAQKEGVTLCAVHKNQSDRKIVCEMKSLFSTIKQYKV